MITTLEQATSRLIQEYNPEQIILFGSHASGTAAADSDFDLLIIKKSAKRPLDRQIEVERILAPRAIPLDLLVFTPEEMHQLFSRSHPLIEEILDKGQVLYMRIDTKIWLLEAGEDLAVAELLHRNAHFRAACYHGQQCAEKALKALILERGGSPRKTHDLFELHQTTAELKCPVAMDLDDVAFLNSIYRGRYPADVGLLPRGEPVPEESERALRLARRVLEAVQAWLP